MENNTYLRMLTALLELTVHENASDLHIAPGMYPLVREGGVLLSVDKHPVITAEESQGMLFSMLSPAEQKEFQQVKEIDFSYTLADGSRFRVNGFTEQNGVAIAFRYIPNVIQTFEELGLPPVLDTFTQRKQGLFLVVGPVGQGKSTSLAAMIERINETRATHITTIEDPIEYRYTPKKSYISQREVRNDTVSFASGLHGALRQDINVLLLGEMRGIDAIATTITAAETGHLVFATMHTNTAAQTIDRIIDSFPPEGQGQIRMQLSSALIGVLSQRLVPKIGGGRAPVVELLVNTPAVSNLIREKRTHEIQSAIETGFEFGMIEMNHSLADLVARGEITVETAYANSPSPRTLEQLL